MWRGCALIVPGCKRGDCARDLCGHSCNVCDHDGGAGWLSGPCPSLNPPSLSINLGHPLLAKSVDVLVRTRPRDPLFSYVS